MNYLLNSSMENLDPDFCPKEGDILLSLITPEECRERCQHLPSYSLLARNMVHRHITCCKADMLRDCIIGTLLIPDKQFLPESSLSLTFYIRKDLVLLIDDDAHIDTLVTVLRGGSLLDSRTAAEFFCRFLSYLTNEDALFLQEFEQRLGSLEEQIFSADSEKTCITLLRARKDLLIFHSYYRQLLDLGKSMAENSGHFFAEEDCQTFSVYASRMERLYHHTQTLREYALQVKEMYQNQADLHRNHTIQMLTVITSIFLPLSLVTGWYGMNFKNMPELQSPHGYFILTGICALLVLGEIWLFHKNKWFL